MARGSEAKCKTSGLPFLLALGLACPPSSSPPRCRLPAGTCLVHVMWALAVTGHPGRTLFGPLCEGLYSRLGELQPQHLSAVLWAMAAQGFYDPELVSAISTFLYDYLPDLRTRWEMGGGAREVAEWRGHAGMGREQRGRVRVRRTHARRLRGET